MVTIQCTEHERARLLKIVQKAREQRYADCNAGKINEYELEYDVALLDELIDRIKGKKMSDDEYLLTSWKYNRNHGTKTEREKDIIDPQKLFESSLM